MNRRPRKTWIAATVTVSMLAMGGFSACIPGIELPPIFDPAAYNIIERWNQIAIDASGLDHAPVSANESRTFGHQLGPGKSARAMAIVHIAIFDAMNAIVGGYESYTGIEPAKPNTSARAAVAQAAHDTLVAMYPSHAATLDNHLETDLNQILDGEAKSNGIELGAAAAAAILDLRDADGADELEDYVFDDQPGKWRVDPLNPNQGMLGSKWSLCKPFVITRADQFRAPPPPPLDSAEYAEAYNEVKQYGGDGITTATIRTDEQTQIGTYWAYDGTPSLCAPPRLYNQIARTVARGQRINAMELARLLALTNTALADAGIAIWESKFHYSYWRPITGIREADAGTGTSGLGDNNPATEGDPDFVPLGAPLSNGNGLNFTPPFPAYPSGHAGFGGALFEVLREFFGTDDIRFTFVSDELNGVTVDNEGNVRPLVPRTFNSFSEAEEENGQSRIYLGIHWKFDKVEGIVQGNRVAKHIFENAFQPVE